MESNLVLHAETGFSLLTIVFFGLLVNELKRGVDATSWHVDRKKKVSRTIVLSLTGWIVFIATWSGSGIMGNFSNFPFNFLPVIAIPLITVAIISFTSTFKDILSHIPPARIIRLQSFRFFVELCLWVLFVANVLPVQMTFEGYNFDILAGISAPVIAWFIVRQKISRTALIVWNIACLLLLINIVTIAILSTPSPVRVFMNEPVNTIVTTFPSSLLPGLLVPLAYTLHFFSLRQLLSVKARPIPSAG